MDSLAVVAFLILWCVLGLEAVRRAERRFDARSDSRLLSLELAVGITIAIAAVELHPAPQAAICGAACIALVVASGADARTGLLFDAITLPAAVLVATLALVFGSGSDAAWGVATVVGTFGCVVLVSRGRAMGLGDVKAMYAVGAAFGPLETLVVIFAACVSGIVAAKLRGNLVRGGHVRFGPHLACGSAFALVVGDPIVHRVLGF